MWIKVFDSFESDFIPVREVMEIYKLFSDKTLDPRCLLELFFKEKLSLFTYILHVNNRLFFTEKDIEAKNLSESYIRFHTVNLDGDKEVIYPSTNFTNSKINLENKGQKYAFDELNIKGIVKYNQDIDEVLDNTPCNRTVLKEIIFANFFEINFRSNVLRKEDIDEEINNNCEYISILSEYLGLFTIQYDLSENKILRHPYKEDDEEYYISDLWIKAESETDFKISFLDDVYILKTDLDYLFNECPNLDRYQAKNIEKEEEESNIKMMIENSAALDQAKDAKIAQLEAELQALKNTRKTGNDSKEREVKTYKTLLLGVLLAMDIKENARKYRYWGKKGVNFSGFASEVIRQLETHTEEHEEIRNKTTYERKLKEVIALLQEYNSK